VAGNVPLHREERIGSLTTMAGALGIGNSSPVAEFNVWVDPDAADIVFRSRLPKTMVSLESHLPGCHPRRANGQANRKQRQSLVFHGREAATLEIGALEGACQPS